MHLKHMQNVMNICCYAMLVIPPLIFILICGQLRSYPGNGSIILLFLSIPICRLST